MTFVVAPRLELVSLSLGASPPVKLSLHAHYTSSLEVSPTRTIRLHDLRRRANRQDNTPLMHRRLALMLLASARALRPIASLRGGAKALRRASAAPTMSDTHCSSVLNFRRPARPSRFRNVTTPSPRQRTHRSRPTQALRLLSDRRRLGRHRLGAPRGDARCGTQRLVAELTPSPR